MAEANGTAEPTAEGSEKKKKKKARIDTECKSKHLLPTVICNHEPAPCPSSNPTLNTSKLTAEPDGCSDGGSVTAGAQRMPLVGQPLNS